jgi:BMFP domain-containing protein YqiC
LHYTRHAYEQWKRRSSLLRSRSKAEALAFQKRIERLEAKGNQWGMI